MCDGRAGSRFASTRCDSLGSVRVRHVRPSRALISGEHVHPRILFPCLGHLRVLPCPIISGFAEVAPRITKTCVIVEIEQTLRMNKG